MPKNIKKLLFFISISSFLLHPSITMEELSENETGYTRQREIQLEKIVEIAWKNFNRYGSCGDKGYTGLATQYFSTGGSQIVLACQYEFCTYHRTGLQEVALRYKKEYESALYDLQEFRRPMLEEEKRKKQEQKRWEEKVRKENEKIREQQAIREKKEWIEQRVEQKRVLDIELSSEDINEMDNNQLFSLAFKYYTLGIEEIDAKKNAAKLFKLSAEKGHPEAQYHIGKCYDEGYGLEIDTEEAAKWYLMAAEQGIDDAQVMIGIFYEYGFGGVNKDFKEAVKWYLKATTSKKFKTYLDAVDRLEKYQDGNLYFLSAEKGNFVAQYRLGLAYFNGHGVKQDKEEAVKWYIKAAKQNHLRSIDALQSLGYKKNSETNEYQKDQKDTCNIF